MSYFNGVQQALPGIDDAIADPAANVSPTPDEVKANVLRIRETLQKQNPGMAVSVRHIARNIYRQGVFAPGYVGVMHDGTDRESEGE